MNYKELKNLTSGLLIGDNIIPKDDDVVKALLSYAYNNICNYVESLHLLTMDRNKDINRTAIGKYLLRTPKLPESDNDELDVDHELGFVAARFMASFISKDNKVFHENEAIKLINQYNGKVEAILNRVMHDDKREEGDEIYVR